MRCYCRGHYNQGDQWVIGPFARGATPRVTYEKATASGSRAPTAALDAAGLLVLTYRAEQALPANLVTGERYEQIGEAQRFAREWKPK
jgi:hypothetical protein